MSEQPNEYSAPLLRGYAAKIAEARDAGDQRMVEYWRAKKQMAELSHNLVSTYQS
jgi:hypothetical protein